MFYGNALNGKTTNDNVFDNPVIAESAVLTEYFNRSSMLENCTNSDESYVLVSEVNLLYEVSIKEIFTKLKNWVKARLLSLVKALEKLFSKGKKTKFKDKILSLLAKAKKALGDVEKAETKEDVEEVKKDCENMEKEAKETAEEVANETGEAPEQINSDEDSKEGENLEKAADAVDQNQRKLPEGYSNDYKAKRNRHGKK